MKLAARLTTNVAHNNHLPRLPHWYAPLPEPRDCVRTATEIVVVRAPAGAGKTLLVADALREPFGSTIVWLDHESARGRLDMWSALAERVADAGAGAGSSTGSHWALEERRSPVATWIDRVAATLDRTLTLVLDGFDDWQDGHAVVTDICRLLAATTHARVVVTARRRTPFEDARVAGAHALRAVAGADLALDRNQLRHMAARLNVEVDDPGLIRLHAATGGHAAASRSILGAAERGEIDLRSATFATVRRASARYGLATLPDVNNALVGAWERIAVPEEVTVELASHLLGDGAGRALIQAEAHGLGSWTTGDTQTFQFVPTIRLGLRQRLRQRDPQAYDEVLDHVQAWASEADDYLERLALAVERGDYSLADALAVRQSENLGDIGLDRLQRILEAVPRGEIVRHPFLGGLIAASYHSRPETRGKGVEYFAIVAGALLRRLASAGPSERLALRALESIALRLTGHGDAAARAARAALEHLDESLGRTPFEGLIWLVSRQMAISLFMAGYVDDAVSTMEKAWDATRDDVAGRLGADTRLALFHAVSGDIDLAAAVTESLPSDMALTSTLGIYSATPGVLARALASLERGDLDACESRLRWLDSEMETSEMWPVHAIAESLVRMQRGHGDTVDSYLDGLLRRGARCPTTKTWRERLAAVRALAALSSARADEAHRITGRVSDRDPLVLHVSAAAMMAEERYGEAMEILGRRSHRAPATSRTDATHSLLAAVCSARIGSFDVASRDLERWMATSMRAGCRSWWLLLTDEDRDLVHGLVPHHRAAWVEQLADLPVVVQAGLVGAGLSEREIVVLETISELGRIAPVARALFVSPNTIKTQLRSIYRKLGVDNRLDALAEAARRGLLR